MFDGKEPQPQPEGATMPDQTTDESLEVLEAILNRVDRIDDWTLKLLVWVRGYIIATIVIIALAVLTLAGG